LLVLWCRVPAAAQPRPTGVDRDFDDRARAEIASVSTAAAEAWDRGNAARTLEMFGDAEEAYAIAAGLAPDIDHVHRRLCGVATALKHFERAMRACRRAVELRPAQPYNKAALAQMLGARNQPRRSRGGSRAGARGGRAGAA
jgi:hypothetical protein